MYNEVEMNDVGDQRGFDEDAEKPAELVDPELLKEVDQNVEEGMAWEVGEEENPALIQEQAEILESIMQANQQQQIAEEPSENMQFAGSMQSRL